MTRSTLLNWCVLACLLAAACSGSAPTRTGPPPFDLDATRQLIAQQNERFTKAHLTGDIATIDAMFTPDATSFPPGAAAVTGLPALHAFTVDYIKAGLTEFREETTAFYGNSEHVVDAGTYVVTYGPDHVTERGKYLNVWQQLNGSWKIKSNMWNTDAPSPAPK